MKSCMVDNNGSLERIAPDWMINRLRRKVANDIASEDAPYGKVLEIFDKWNVFGTWTVYEINNRPVDTESLSEAVEMEVSNV